MTRRVALLDVNVLVALAWPNHTHHALAAAWFDEAASRGWATTPFTEAGFVRVSANRRILPAATSPTIALDLLNRLTALPGYEFWPDDVRLVTDAETARQLRGHRQITDAHLLTLARHRGGRLVTFDQALAQFDADGDTVLVPPT